MTTEKWTLVQHSAYGYANDPQFFGGLEERSVGTPGRLLRIEEAGGVLVDSYLEASELAETLMYPEAYKGLTPVAHWAGKFHRRKVDGLRVFIPKGGK